MIAGTLEIQMMADLARLADDMAKAKSLVGGAMSDIEKSVGSAKKLLASLGIGLSVGFFANLIVGSIKAMDHLGDLSKTTNILVEDLAGLGIAAKQSGADLGSIGDSITKLSVNMGKDAAKFRELGITTKDPLEAFKQLADIYVALEDPQQRAAVMAEALGKSWAGAAPLLAEGSKKIADMIDVGKKASGITEEMARQADELSDKWVLLGGTGGTLVRLVSPILPLLNTLADEALRTRQESDKLNDSWAPLKTALEAVVILGANVAFVLKAVGTEIGGIAAQAMALSQLDFQRFREIRKQMIEDGIQARKDLEDFEKRVLAAGQKRAAAPTAKPDGADDAAINAIIAAEKARKFLSAKKDGADDEAIAEVIREAKAAAQREQEVRDAMHKVRVEDDDRELAQVKRTNEERARAQAEFDYQTLIQEEAVQDEVDRIQRESILGRMAFEKQQREDQFTGAKMFADNLATLMNTQSRKAFEIGKIASISSAVIKGYESAVSAYAFGQRIGGPVVGAAFAAASLISTANLINNIRSQTFGGGGGAPTPAGQGASGVSSGPATPLQQQPPAASAITLNLTVNGHVLDTQDFTDTILIPALRDAIDNRDVTIIGANSRQAADLAPA